MVGRTVDAFRAHLPSSPSCGSRHRTCAQCHRRRRRHLRAQAAQIRRVLESPANRKAGNAWDHPELRMPDAAWRAPGSQFKGTFSAVLDETNRFTRTDDAVPARRFRLVKTLVGDFEKRVIVGRIACAACDADADSNTARLARVRVR